MHMMIKGEEEVRYARECYEVLDNVNVLLQQPKKKENVANQKRDCGVLSVVVHCIVVLLLNKVANFLRM